jgi:hypothetical protein
LLHVSNLKLEEMGAWNTEGEKECERATELSRDGGVGACSFGTTNRLERNKAQRKARGRRSVSGAAEMTWEDCGFFAACSNHEKVATFQLGGNQMETVYV